MKLHQHEIKNLVGAKCFSPVMNLGPGFNKHAFIPEGMGFVASSRETILMNESIEICLKLNPCGSSLCSLF